LQRTQYYPSGLPWKSNSGDNPGSQPYKYGGKEFVEMHGLDEYDSDARWYYPAIMRTTTMDPLAEKYYDISPYVWCGNNPVRFVDPDGREIIFPESGGKPAEEKKNGVYTTAQSTTYIPEKKTVEPVKPTKNEQQRMMVNSEGAQRNKGTITQGKSNLERAMDIVTTPEFKQVAQNPVVQASVVAASATVVAPALVVAGNTAIIATEGSVILSAGAGAVEGVVKGLTNAPPDAPYLISSPFYQTTSDVTNFTTTNIVNYLKFTSNDKKK
jgi:RHS repeat-associated protein